MSYTVKIFDPETNKNELFELWQYKSEKLLQRRFDYLYGNSAYSYIITNMIYHDKEENAVGMASIFGRNLMVKGKDIRIGVNCDIVVKKKHRTLGPAIMLVKSLLKQAENTGYKVLIAYPNKMSQLVFKKVGYKNIGTSYRWSRLINSEKKIRSQIKNQVASKILSRIFDTSMSLVSAETLTKIRYGKIIKKTVKVNITYDEITITKNDTDEVSIDRSSEYMKWRYYGVDKYDSKIFAVSINGLISGIIIYNIQAGEVIIEDILSDKTKGAIEVLIYKFIKKIKKIGVFSISIMHYGIDNLEKVMKSYGFFRREGRDIFLYTFDSSAEEHVMRLSFMNGDVDL